MALHAQAQSEATGASSTAHDPSPLTFSPRRPQLGSLVLLSFRRSRAAGDSIIELTGWMGGEPLHFRPDSDGIDRAFGVVPLEASDSVVARVVVQRASGELDTLRTSLAVPHRVNVNPTGGRPARARRLRVSKVFTTRPDSLTEARVERENEEARAIGHRSHQTPQLWSQPFERPRS